MVIHYPTMKNPVVILLSALALTYPALWWGGRMPGEWTLFSECAWCLACMLFLALVPERLRRFADMAQENVRQVFYCMIPAGIVLLLHYYYSRGNTDLLCRGLFWFVLPIFGAVYAKELKKPLLWAVLLLGCTNLFALGLQLIKGMPPYGITGNWNWSATLLLASVLAGAGLCGEKKKWIPFLTGGVLGVFFCCLPDWQAYFPRGTVAAAGMALVLFCGLAWTGKRCRVFRIGVLLWLVVCAVFGLLQVEKDVTRSALAEGAVSVIKSHPLGGVGPGRFESEIPQHLPIRYYDGAFPSERHPHPHNQLLKFMAEFGVSGAVLFGMFCLILYRSLRTVKKEPELWLMAAMLTIHGMVDVLLEEWPLNVVWLLALGILWGESVTLKEPDVPEMEKSNVYWPLRVVQIMLAVLLCVQVVREGTSGFYARRAKLGGGAADWERSRKWKVTPENLYAGAMHALFDRKDPKAALQFLSRMEPETTFRNYLHNQGLTARALAAGGKIKESLSYFESEQRNFPVSAVNLYFYAQVLQKSGETAKAAEMRLLMHKILAARGRTAADLPELIRNPALELRKNHEL